MRWAMLPRTPTMGRSRSPHPLPQQLTSVRAERLSRSLRVTPSPASFSTTATSSVGALIMGALSLWALGILMPTYPLVQLVSARAKRLLRLGRLAAFMCAPFLTMAP